MWIEISAIHGLLKFVESQPAKAVWIEILMAGISRYGLAVTACEGCVD